MTQRRSDLIAANSVTATTEPPAALAVTLPALRRLVLSLDVRSRTLAAAPERGGLERWLLPLPLCRASPRPKNTLRHPLAQNGSQPEEILSTTPSRAPTCACFRGRAPPDAQPSAICAGLHRGASRRLAILLRSRILNMITQHSTPRACAVARGDSATANALPPPPLLAARLTRTDRDRACPPASLDGPAWHRGDLFVKPDPCCRAPRSILREAFSCMRHRQLDAPLRSFAGPPARKVASRVLLSFRWVPRRSAVAGRPR